MEFEKRLAKAIVLTQKLREKSFDKTEADRMKKEDKYPNFEKCYTLSIYEASDKAAEQLGFDLRMTQPVYLLNRYCWNDIQIWAEEVMAK